VVLNNPCWCSPVTVSYVAGRPVAGLRQLWPWLITAVADTVVVTMAVMATAGVIMVVHVILTVAIITTVVTIIPTIYQAPWF
jgi:hypothetical protein